MNTVFPFGNNNYNAKQRHFKSGDLFYKTDVRYVFYLRNSRSVNRAFPDAYKSILAWHEFDMVVFNDITSREYDPYIVVSTKQEIL